MYIYIQIKKTLIYTNIPLLIHLFILLCLSYLIPLALQEFFDRQGTPSNSCRRERLGGPADQLEELQSL